MCYLMLHADMSPQKELSDPATYEGFTKEDWEDLRSILPENVPVADDGYSIPFHWLRYDPDFRRGIREFQEDLGAGRLDPKWLAEAAEAMEERANGEFDAFKEKNYEEFWGQKQKLSREALAGESTTLKLEVMIEHGLFRVGDELVFSRAIGKGVDRKLFEKECSVQASIAHLLGSLTNGVQIVKLGRKTMTVAIPPGRQKFSRSLITPKPSPNPKKPLKRFGANSSKVISASAQDHNEPAILNGDANEETNIESPKEDPLVGNSTSKLNAISTESSTHHDILGETAIDAPMEPPQNVSKAPSEAANSLSSLSEPPADPPADEPVLHEFNNLKQLNDKIIELDGRLNPKSSKEVPAVSPWKLIRVKRNNQDLGTMFEMREEFYVYKLPHLNKKSKR